MDRLAEKQLKELQQRHAQVSASLSSSRHSLCTNGPMRIVLFHASL